MLWNKIIRWHYLSHIQLLVSLGFPLLRFLHFLQTTHNSLSCCLFGWLLLRMRLFILFYFIFLFVSSTIFPLHTLAYQKKEIHREQKLGSVTHLCLSSPNRNNLVWCIHRKCQREVKADICGNTCSMACYLFQPYWGHISHTTGRILYKVDKPILFYNPALTCIASDSLSVTIKHCIVRKTVHKCYWRLQPI